MLAHLFFYAKNLSLNSPAPSVLPEQVWSPTAIQARPMRIAHSSLRRRRRRLFFKNTASNNTCKDRQTARPTERQKNKTNNRLKYGSLRGPLLHSERERERERVAVTQDLQQLQEALSLLVFVVVFFWFWSLRFLQLKLAFLQLAISCVLVSWLVVVVVVVVRFLWASEIKCCCCCLLWRCRVLLVGRCECCWASNSSSCESYLRGLLLLLLLLLWSLRFCLLCKLFVYERAPAARCTHKAKLQWFSEPCAWALLFWFPSCFLGSSDRFFLFLKQWSELRFRWSWRTEGRWQSALLSQ